MIKGVSDVRRLPRLGKIRLGEIRKSAKTGGEYPAALDHFRFDEKEVPELLKLYGPNCREIDILLPVEDTELFFHQARTAYGSSRVFCRCDNGDTATRIRVGGDKDPQGEKFIAEQGLQVKVGDRFQMPCAGAECPWTDGTNPSGKKVCKGIGRFMFLVPRSPRFGCYEITTSSFHGMVALNSYIDAIRATAGRISYIPLKLKLVPRSIAPEGKKKTVHVLEIVYEGTMAQLAEYRNSDKLLPVMPKLALPTREEIEASGPPEDIIPEGGKTLDEAVGFIDESASFEDDPAPAEPTPPAEPLPPPPPAEQARAKLEPKPEPRKPARRI